MNNCMNNLNSCVCNNSYRDCRGTNYCCIGVIPCCSRNCCNQCGKRCCCCCCPVVPTAPMPPMPPIPPIPPPIPGGNFAQFEAPAQMINNAGMYRVNLINIQGDPAQFDPGTNTITLKPNTVYRYSYAVETTILGAVPSDISNALLLGNASIQGTVTEALDAQPGVLTVLQSNGQFMTGNAPLNLSLAISTNPGVQVMTSGAFTIEEV